MFDWLNGPGAELKHHIPGSTNYVTQLRSRKFGEEKSESSGQKKDDADADADNDGPGLKQPFPLNPLFVSEPILSEKLSNEIYKQVVHQGKSVRSVSADLRVDMRRVGAVVRLKELEKRMKDEVFPLFFFLFFPHSQPFAHFSVYFNLSRHCNDEQKKID